VKEHITVDIFLLPGTKCDGSISSNILQQFDCGKNNFDYHMYITLESVPGTNLY